MDRDWHFEWKWRFIHRTWMCSRSSSHTNRPRRLTSGSFTQKGTCSTKIKTWKGTEPHGKDVVARQTEPSERTNSLVTIVKPNKIWVCMDQQDLKAIKREHYLLCTIEEEVAEMPNTKIFSVVDANQGFWKIQLDEESSWLHINTPFGRYSFTRLLFWIASLQRCLAQNSEGLKGVINIMDDLSWVMTQSSTTGDWDSY